MMKEFNLSVVILTYNEEKNIEKSINSCKILSDDIVVLDSYSHDNTCELAAILGARIIQNEFVGYATQRNFAFREIDFKNQWLLMLDADELVTTELSGEINELISTTSKSMFSCRRKDYLFNKWLKYSSGYPTWFPRLFKLGDCWVEREINEVYRTSGDEGRLQGHLHHYPFNKGIKEWFHKHNNYSEMEAELIARNENKLVIKNLWNTNKQLKREAQKALVYKMPLRPLIVFFIFYILKRGFMDGKSGFYYCLMKLCYELMISCKVFERNKYEN